MGLGVEVLGLNGGGIAIILPLSFQRRLWNGCSTDYSQPPNPKP